MRVIKTVAVVTALLLLAMLVVFVSTAYGQEASQEVPAGADDPTCSTGDYFIWYNTADAVWRKCEDGAVILVGIGDPTSTVNGPDNGAPNPDRKPVDGDLDLPCSDEFKNGVSTGTWSWANQSTATLTVDLDYAKLDDTNDTGSHAYGCTPANSGNWTVTAKVTVFGGSTPANGGLVFIDGGTWASPTTIVGFILRRDGTSSGSALSGTKATWATTTWTTLTSETQGSFSYAANRATICLQARYVNSTKVMTFRYAEDCRHFGPSLGTRTFTNHPGAIGFAIETASGAGSTARITVQWIRTNTSSAGNASPFFPGR